MLELRSPQAIARELLRVPDGFRLGRDYSLPSIEIAGDFVLLDARSAKEETEGRDAPLAGLAEDWWIFAISGTGDAWLISTDDGQRICFLDHDAGPDAVPQALGIDFGQWLQLADLLRQFESADDDRLTAQVAQLLDAISAGLSARYPYRLEV
ncbi:hypothetical protein DBA29_14500 [Xenophilus aerolatus]|nr:hypothetical protein [Xenophilus aerolatus]